MIQINNLIFFLHMRRKQIKTIYNYLRKGVRKINKEELKKSEKRSKYDRE